MKRDWALVLSGGGPKGFAHIGVIKFLEENGLIPGLIVGTSVGAIVGGAWASGRSAKDIEKFIKKHFNIKELLDISDMPLMKIIHTGEAIRNIFTKLGAYETEKLHRLYFELTHRRYFDETEIPFVCNAVDLLSQKHIIIEEGHIADGLRASTAVPGFFPPFEKDGMMLVDGGITDNLPVQTARERGFKKVIAVNLNTNTKLDKNKLQNGLDVIIEALFINTKCREKTPINTPDIEITATTEEFDINNFDSYHDLIEFGYNQTLEKKDEIKELIKKKEGIISFINSIKKKIGK